MRRFGPGRTVLLVCLGLLYAVSLALMIRASQVSLLSGIRQDTYRLSTKRPYVVVVERDRREEQMRQNESLTLGLSLFSSALLVLTVLDVAGTGVAAWLVRLGLSLALTCIAFVGSTGGDFSFRLHLPRLPWTMWIVAAQLVVVMIVHCRRPVDAAMRPTDLLLVFGGFALFVGCVAALRLVI